MEISERDALRMFHRLASFECIPDLSSDDGFQVWVHEKDRQVINRVYKGLDRCHVVAQITAVGEYKDRVKFDVFVSGLFIGDIVTTPWSEMDASIQARARVDYLNCRAVLHPSGIAGRTNKPWMTVFFSGKPYLGEESRLSWGGGGGSLCALTWFEERSALRSSYVGNVDIRIDEVWVTVPGVLEGRVRRPWHDRFLRLAEAMTQLQLDRKIDVRISHGATGPGAYVEAVHFADILAKELLSHGLKAPINLRTDESQLWAQFKKLSAGTVAKHRHETSEISRRLLQNQVVGVEAKSKNSDTSVLESSAMDMAEGCGAGCLLLVVGLAVLFIVITLVFAIL